MSSSSLFSSFASSYSYLLIRRRSGALLPLRFFFPSFPHVLPSACIQCTPGFRLGRMSTVRARCVYYETCFVMRDDAAGPLVIDPFETAVHPVLSKMNRRVSSDCEAERHDPTEVHHHGRRGFSLHLSPKQRIICNSEAVLSPISDKSETNGGEVVTVKSHVSRCRPALSLFKPIGYNNTSSDSGISAGGSAASSHEALLQRPSGFKPVSLSNSHGTISVRPSVRLSLSLSLANLICFSFVSVCPSVHPSVCLVGMQNCWKRAFLSSCRNCIDRAPD